MHRLNVVVFCHLSWRLYSAMTPYVQWKNQIGFPTEIVNVSTIGNTTCPDKNYVTNYYNTHGLAYLLLLVIIRRLHTYGSYTEVQHIQIIIMVILQVMIVMLKYCWTFFCNNISTCQTQVQRKLNMKKQPEWYKLANDRNWHCAPMKGSGIGHDGGEADYVHINNIRTRLLAYNYTTVHQEYDQKCSRDDT
jgi:hypothetical protein